MSSALVCVDPDVELANAERVDPADLAALTAPKSNFRRAKGLCKECGAPKNTRRDVAAFCSDRCRAAFHNRAKVQGATLIHAAKRWRRFRDKGSFALVTKILDDMIREDKAAGINSYPNPPLSAYVKVVGTNVQGRKRR